MLGLIKRSFQNKKEETFPLLYRALVRPHLEYANVPHYILNQKAVENVQRRATKMIPNIRRLTYKDRLRHLDIPSLQHRRNRGDMITTYKILTGKFNIDKHKQFKFHHLNTRGHPFKIFNEYSKSFLKSHLFSYRIVNSWNSLPSQVFEAKSVNVFKNLLDKF